MAYLILPSRRTRQPSGPVRIDYANQLCRGLVAHFHAPTLTVNGILTSTNTGVRAAGSSGIGVDYVGGQTTSFTQQYATGDALTTSSGMSVAVLFDVDALTNYSAVVTNQVTSTTYCPIELRLGSGATDSNINVVRATAGGSYRAHDTGTNRYSAGDRAQLLVISFADDQVVTAPTIWAKRVKYSGSLVGSSGTGSVAASPSAVLQFGTRPGGVTQLDGRVYGAWFWNRPLLDAEVLALYDNVWQVYTPEKRSLYFGAAGGGVFELDAQPGGYTINGTAATLARGIVVNAQPGTYALTGTAATLAKGYNLNAATGTYTVNGTAATLARGLVVNAAPGSYTLSGVDATLEKVTPGVYTIDAQPGTFALTGVAATLTYTPLNAYTIDAQPGSYVITGIAAGLTYAGSSIWTDVGLTAASWSAASGSSTTWTDI